MIQELVQAGLAPFLSEVGWQGFAYGLLGLKTIKKTVRTARSIYEDDGNGQDN